MDDSGGSLSSADLVVGGLGTLTNGAAAGSFSTAYQTTAGEAFSYSNSFTAGDANNGTGTISTVYTAGSVVITAVVHPHLAPLVLIMVLQSLVLLKVWYKCNCPVRHGSNRY